MDVVAAVMDGRDRWMSLGSDFGGDGSPWEARWTRCLLESLVRMKSEMVPVPPHHCRWDVTSGKIKYLDRAMASGLLKFLLWFSACLEPLNPTTGKEKPLLPL